ncbi:hypothetical protein MOV08_05295 [Streptomyces yunnanensis]|uniref:Uncharacterized protein n=1 Tax=Streptomyces yunnanensis TaxID=156453 RepID=A0ABY8A1Y0_9ACTN|nr:hypothetical protein [Streptomyces yunnanensis]WEB38776.1 hypothetical protein MOV08_05295 [Streptomyces yunnanensis]
MTAVALYGLMAAFCLGLVMQHRKHQEKPLLARLGRPTDEDVFCLWLAVYLALRAVARGLWALPALDVPLTIAANLVLALVLVARLRFEPKPVK